MKKPNIKRGEMVKLTDKEWQILLTALAETEDRVRRLEEYLAYCGTTGHKDQYCPWEQVQAKAKDYVDRTSDRGQLGRLCRDLLSKDRYSLDDIEYIK